MFSKHLGIGVCLLVTVAAFADDKPITNKQLIAAMPPQTESVMVLRHKRLGAAHSAFRSEFGRPGITDLQRPAANLKGEIQSAVFSARPIVIATGGSMFEAPISSPAGGKDAIGIGVGNYEERTISIVEDSLVSLRKQLDERVEKQDGLDAMQAGRIRIFHATIDTFPGGPGKIDPVREPFFICFVSERCIVTAESQTDVEHIVRTLRDEDATLPAKWRKIADGHDVESAIIILREYNPKNDRDFYSPVNPKWPESSRAAVKSFALSLPKLEENAFLISAQAADGERALKWYRRRSLPVDGDYAYDVRTTTASFTGSLRYRDNARQPSFCTYYTGNSVRCQRGHVISTRGKPFKGVYRGVPLLPRFPAIITRGGSVELTH